MNGPNTVKSYKKILIPFYRRLSKKHPWIKFECEGDNAPGHTANVAINYLKKNKINHTQYGGSPKKQKGGHPANSPDIFCIERVFSVWHDKVANRNPQTVEDLVKIATEEWDKIPLQLIRNCIKHTAKGIIWVRNNDGKQFR